MTTLKNPHLPQSNVTSVLCGNTNYSAENELTRLGIEIIKIRELPHIESALNMHTDLAVCPLPGDTILIQPSQSFLKDKLISYGYSVIIAKREAFSPYPTDCDLNFVYTCNYYIGSKNICSDVVVKDFKVIITKQGYSKCSVAPVSENAIITDDTTIAKGASEKGIDVCLVEKGDICLNGYHYGFIGGTCGKLSNDIIAFNGNLNSHRDCDKIRSFLRNWNVYPLNLSNTQLNDIGSIIPISQKKGFADHEKDE